MILHRCGLRAFKCSMDYQNQFTKTKIFTKYFSNVLACTYYIVCLCAYGMCMYVCDLCLYVQSSFCTYIHLPGTKLYCICHDDVINWKHFPRYWPFARRFRWIPFTKASDVELWCFLWSASEQTEQNWDAGDLRRHSTHYDVTVMYNLFFSHALYIFAPCIVYHATLNRIYLILTLHYDNVLVLLVYIYKIAF